MGRIIICLQIWLSLLTLFSCDGYERENKFLIGFSQCCADPWRDVMEDEMYRELNFHPEVGFEIKVASNNSSLQIEQIRELVKLGIDVLIVAPNESTPLTQVVDEVYQSGIPVIMIDRKTNSDKYSAYLGADNYEIGKTAGDYIANKFKGEGQVIELKLPMDISPAAERTRGFRDALSRYPNLEVVADMQINHWPKNVDEDFALLLQQHPEADIVFAHTDLIAEQAYKVSERFGRADSLFFVGVDGIPGQSQGIQAVEDGILDASMLYPTGGVEAIRLALAILNNLPYEKKNLLQTTVIDPSNARILHFQMKKVSDLKRSIDKQKDLIDELDHMRQYQRIINFILLFSLLLALILGGFLWRSLRTKQIVNKRLELKNKEVLEKQQQVVEMSEEVRRATQAKVEFFTNISHEFRTPLTLILGFAEDLLPSASLNKEIKQSIRLIKENAFRLLRLVNQLMDFRKVESGKMEVRACENDLIEFVRNIMKSYFKVAEKRGIDFKLITKEEQLPLWFDSSMMDKVLYNLLSNAFKFTPNNGRIHIIISVDSFENLAKIKVEDSGKGIAAAEVEKVFEPFYQEKEGLKMGTGLGLPLSKALIRLHHGDIKLTSIKGKGSRFVVTLPLGKEHFKDEQLLSEKPVTYFEDEPIFVAENDMEELSGYQKPATDKKLLLIEDNTEVLGFLKKKLASEYEILEAFDGDKGLHLAFEEIPDLIISDVMMPNRDGLEITKSLKSDLRTSHIPIILLTARSSIEQEIEGIKTGADAYITKPFNVQFLQEKIKNLLHNRQILKESYGKEILAFKENVNVSSLDQDFVKKFMAYVEENFARQDLQVTDLCEELNLSRSQLYRKVKALLGLNISDYIQNIRLKKAEELLLAEELSVADIAYQVGYTSPDYFSTVFKSKYNEAPSQFRKKLLAEEQQN